MAERMKFGFNTVRNCRFAGARQPSKPKDTRFLVFQLCARAFIDVEFLPGNIVARRSPYSNGRRPLSVLYIDR